MSDRRKLPKYGLHRATGQARVWLDGRDHYLGPYDSPESKARYRELIDAWRLREDESRPIELSVGELVLLYVEHATAYYRKHGKPTSEVACVRAACRFLMPHRRRRAADFGPLLLEAVRGEMVRADLARTTINAQCGRIRRMMRWAVAKQLLRPEVVTSLAAVAAIREGRSEAREPDPVGPVPREHVEAVLPLLSPALRSVVEVLRLTGARTGEILPMRTGDLDRSADPWEYRPRSHKTEHKGKRRVIVLGPRAREVVEPLLLDDPEGFVFRPRKSSRERYHGQAVRKAVMRACLRLNAARGAVGLDPIRVWHPHQLRHEAGTRFRKEFGFEAARTALGHSSPDMTELYAERDLDVVREMAAAIG